MELAEATIKLNAIDYKRSQQNAQYYIPYVMKSYDHEKAKSGILKPSLPFQFDQIQNKKPTNCEFCAQNLQKLIDSQDQILKLLSDQQASEKVRLEYQNCKNLLEKTETVSKNLLQLLKKERKDNFELKLQHEKSLNDVIGAVKVQNDEYESSAILQLNNIISGLKCELSSAQREIQEGLVVQRLEKLENNVLDRRLGVQKENDLKKENLHLQQQIQLQNEDLKILVKRCLKYDDKLKIIEGNKK
eukprot:EST49404.1 Hypothetical protein SS50377_10329 [Spironucleus salmonicida]